MFKKFSFLVCDFIASDNTEPLLVIHWPDSNYTVILGIKKINIEMLIIGGRVASLCKAMIILLTASTCPYYLKVSRAQSEHICPPVVSFCTLPSPLLILLFYREAPSTVSGLPPFPPIQDTRKSSQLSCTSWLTDVIFWFKVSLVWLSHTVF